MRSEDGYGAPEERYSPECVEEEFSEVRLKGVLGGSDKRVSRPASWLLGAGSLEAA